MRYLQKKTFGFLLFFAMLLPPLAAAENCEFKIGVVTALSGRLAEYGNAVRNGIELARETHSEVLRCIKFIYEDDQYEPKLAVSALHKLVSSDKVALVFQWGNEPGLAMAPVAESLHVPLISVSQHPDVATKAQPYVVRFINTAADWQGAFAKYLLGQNVKSILVLKTEMSFTQMLVDELSRQFGNTVEVSVLDSVLPTESDFRPIISRAKGKKFDFLALYILPAQAVSFLKQARELDFHPKLIGSTFFESRSALESVWPMLKDAQYLHLAVPEAFRTQYENRFNLKDQVPYAWNSYEFALFAGRHFGKPDAATGSAEILTAFRSRETGGPMLSVTSDTADYMKFPLAIEKVDGTGVKTVVTVEP